MPSGNFSWTTYDELPWGSCPASEPGPGHSRLGACFRSHACPFFTCAEEHAGREKVGWQPKERQKTMQWFGKGRPAAAISFELAAIANCAIHPKFLDEAVVSTAIVDDVYLSFSDRLHDFVETVEEKFAADGHLEASLVQSVWAQHLVDIPQNFVAMRIAQVHFQRLVEVLAPS
jgi:hypothetical protein